MSKFQKLYESVITEDNISNWKLIEEYMIEKIAFQDEIGKIRIMHGPSNPANLKNISFIGKLSRLWGSFIEVRDKVEKTIPTDWFEKNKVAFSTEEVPLFMATKEEKLQKFIDAYNNWNKKENQDKTESIDQLNSAWVKILGTLHESTLTEAKIAGKIVKTEKDLFDYTFGKTKLILKLKELKKSNVATLFQDQVVGLFLLPANTYSELWLCDAQHPSGDEPYIKIDDTLFEMFSEMEIGEEKNFILIK